MTLEESHDLFYSYTAVRANSPAEELNTTIPHYLDGKEYMTLEGLLYHRQGKELNITNIITKGGAPGRQIRLPANSSLL